MTGYVRKDTTNNIADGNVINAADLDSEFDGVQDAFNASTGHKHDGTAGEGATINALGPTQDVTVSATLVAPKTTNTVDIGSSALKFKDLFLAGNGSVGGTLAVTGVATLGNGAILGTPASGTVTNLTGTASININGTVGATTATTGAFTSLTASTTLGVTGNASVVGAAVIGGSRTPSASFPLQVISPYAATDTTERDITFFGSNEATQPFGLAVLVTGNATAANRQINIQTRTTGVANSGVLYLQNSGGSVNIEGLTVGRGAGAVATNTAVGASALASNSTGAAVTAIGSSALAANNADGGTGVGRNALAANTTGTDNTGIGRNALLANTTGANNVSLGKDSLFSNTTASSNTAVGYQAG